MTSTATINKVLDRDHHVCVIQGPFCTVHATVADHRANRGQGGSTILDDPANLIAACELCNGWKEDASGEDRTRLLLRGIRLPKRATNHETVVLARVIPVTFPDGSTWLLSSDDTKELIPHAEAAELLALFGIRVEEAV